MARKKSQPNDSTAGFPKRTRTDILPRSLPPLAVRRELAAALFDLSPTKFDQLVADSRMPKPKKVDGRVIWSVRKLEIAFDALPEEDSNKNEWDER